MEVLNDIFVNKKFNYKICAKPLVLTNQTRYAIAHPHQKKG